MDGASSPFSQVDLSGTGAAAARVKIAATYRAD